MILIHDTHLGVMRSAGTTPASAAALKQNMHFTFCNMLDDTNESLAIVGDLFDSYNVSNTDLLLTYGALKNWQTKGYALYMIPGNHDMSSDSSKLSSFHLLCHLLDVKPSEGLCELEDGIWSISHMVNQDTFDAELAKVKPCDYLLLHANYDNNFATGDHSLNVSKQQATDLPVGHLYFAHEHAHRTALGGKVHIGGNQMPSSVSDCLDKQNKFMTRLTALDIERIQTWDKENYAEITWDAQEPTQAKFVRLVGQCQPERTAYMVSAVAAYRKGSDAFIVSNAVQIGSSEELAEIAATSLEGLKQFDVMGALKEFLTEEEFSKLGELV